MFKLAKNNMLDAGARKITFFSSATFHKALTRGVIKPKKITRMEYYARRLHLRAFFLEFLL